MQIQEPQSVSHTIYKDNYLEFPGGLVVRVWHFHCLGLGSIPGRGTEIPQAAWSAKIIIIIIIN